jgi:splicing factor 3B subunit 1
MRPQDYQYFHSLLTEKNEDDMSAEEAKERKIMKLLLKVGPVPSAHSACPDSADPDSACPDSADPDSQCLLLVP